MNLQKKKKNNNFLWIFLIIILISGIGFGIYYFTQQKFTENPQKDQSFKEEKAKKKMLEKYQTYFTEQDLPSLISQMPYLGDQYPSSNLAEMEDRNSEIMKQKKINLFAQFPANNQEFEEDYKRGEKDKIKFLYVSLIPRKSDGKVDWIKWQEQDEKEEKLLKYSEIKNYLENKTNPTLKKWYDDLKSDPDSVKRLALLNEQLSEYMNIKTIAWQLHKFGKDKGWIDKEYYKDSFKVSYKDASNNQITIDFDLVVKYDLSNWVV